MYSIPAHPVPFSGIGIPLSMVGQVRAGFPSPAADFAQERVDLIKQLIVHPQATFLMRIRGESMKEFGIFDNDAVVVDRALVPRHLHIVVAVVDGDFTCKQLHQLHGRIKLRAGNPTYPDIVPKEGQTLEVWGVVTASIKTFRA
ncbi:translesion error-prone DNA polymerase V autoproteolytic subunit [Achromobacter denitrificans]|nr:translesion error-prone DNA polymerase V autoproteolytic subunit [Achromobacter denitrificans]